MHIAGRIHAALYRLSSGRLAHSTGGLPILLLTTVGRKTGRLRTWPLAYVVDHDRLLVVADALGQATHPSWYWNLQATPRVLVQRGSTTSEMIASTVPSNERAPIWERLVQDHPHYADHQRKTAREFPLVLLDPAPAAAARARRG